MSVILICKKENSEGSHVIRETDYNQAVPRESVGQRKVRACKMNELTTEHRHTKDLPVQGRVRRGGQSKREVRRNGGNKDRIAAITPQAPEGSPLPEGPRLGPKVQGRNLRRSR